MAVSQVTTVQGTPGTGTSATVTVTVSGSNPAVEIGIATTSGTATITNVTSSNTTSSIAQVKPQANTNVSAFIWGAVAPAAGSHTFTVTISASTNFNLYARVWSGADQTTPFPSADAVTSTSGTSPVTLTPANLTANDATGMVGSNDAGNWSSATPNQRIQDNSALAGMQSGDSTGTTGTTFAFAGISGTDISMVAVRVAAAPTSIVEEDLFLNTGALRTVPVVGVWG